MEGIFKKMKKPQKLYGEFSANTKLSTKLHQFSKSFNTYFSKEEIVKF